ncbi:sulfonate ABC transporter substrate-binding protein [Microcoleus sp. D2_18a_D3]|uniref:sulfonate ABC transporter substrate-binding protein n=1 Tax=Microcoleus sp. D2_18a_D3 TaxID=3055330 RepID=UPI002FD4A7FD
MLTPLKENRFPGRLRHLWSKLKHSSIKTFALLFAIGFSLSLTVSACAPTQQTNTTTAPTSAATSVASSNSQQSNVIRIGYQKYGTLSILKSRGSLEKRLASQNISVQWLQFPAGPQLLEALNAGSIDFGHTGEAPPIFAQAAGAPLVYVANEPPNPKGEAILVPKDSPIQDVVGLKGKKVVFNKGSNVHYLVVEALRAAGLKYSDIQPIYLPPAEARAAFEQGSVDAWAIWDPFFTVAKRATDARVLKDGEGLVANREFYLAAKPFNDQYSDRTKAILEELQKIDEWAATQPTEVAKLLSPALGIDVPTLEEVARRRPYGVQPITAEVITYQQKVADTFLDLKLLPKQIKISEVAQVTKQ